MLCFALLCFVLLALFCFDCFRGSAVRVNGVMSDADGARNVPALARLCLAHTPCDVITPFAMYFLVSFRGLFVGPLRRLFSVFSRPYAVRCAHLLFSVFFSRASLGLFRSLFPVFSQSFPAHTTCYFLFSFGGLFLNPFPRSFLSLFLNVFLQSFSRSFSPVFSQSSPSLLLSLFLSLFLGPFLSLFLSLFSRSFFPSQPFPRFFLGPFPSLFSVFSLGL